MVSLILGLVLLGQPAQSFDKTKWMDLKREGQRLEVAESYRTAEKFYRQALEMARAFPPRCSERLETLYHMANILVKQGKYWDAEPYYQRLITVVQEDKKAGTLDHEALVWMEDLADSYCHCVKGWLEYLALEHAVQLRDIISGDNNKYMATTLRRLATRLLHENKYKQAEPYANRLVRITGKFKGPSELAKASDLFLLCLVEYHLGKYARSESNCREALALYTKLEIPPGFCTANCLLHLSTILKAQKQYELAWQTANRSVKIFERNNGKKYIGTVPVLTLLGEIHTARGKYADAIREYDKIISIMESEYGVKDARLTGILELQRKACFKVKNAAKAREIDKRIAAISKRNTAKKLPHGH